MNQEKLTAVSYMEFSRTKANAEELCKKLDLDITDPNTQVFLRDILIK